MRLTIEIAELQQMFNREGIVPKNYRIIGISRNTGAIPRIHIFIEKVTKNG